MSLEYETVQHLAMERISSANNPHIAKIRAEFLKKEDDFYRQHVRNKFVLVAGSGLGHDSLRISQYNKKVIGIDILPLLIKESTKLTKDNIVFEVGDIKNLKYPENHFDVAVLNMGTIGNFDNKLEIIRELARVAKQVFIDFYVDSPEVLEKRKQMYTEEKWKNVAIQGKDIISEDGLESKHVSEQELKEFAQKLNLSLKLHQFCDIGKMAVFGQCESFTQ